MRFSVGDTGEDKKNINLRRELFCRNENVAQLTLVSCAVPPFSSSPTCSRYNDLEVLVPRFN